MAVVKERSRKVAAGSVIRDLQAIAGDSAVTTVTDRRTFFSTDIASRGETAEAVVRVSETATLSKVVASITGHGRIAVPRGGGFSYTGGYTPDTPQSVIIDMRGMDRVLEINTTDMYVVVEAGCTWQSLYETLKPKGVRTPYFGPMSGSRATVGGALSQGSFFLGSTQYGPVSESVLALEVVLADGTVLKTGSWAAEGTPPFLRQFGPDLTGLFLNDTGAMGFKTRAVLRLIPLPPRQAYATFAFTSHAQALAAVSAIGRAAIAAECYCWDPYFVRLMAANATTGGFREDLAILLNVIRNGSNLFDGLWAGARIALAGRGVFKGDTWLMHVTFDDVSGAGAGARLNMARKLAKAAGGKETSPTAPRAMRAEPFINFNTAERRVQRRNLPIHGLMPHSRAPAVAGDIYAYLEANKAEMERVGLNCGVIMIAVGAQATTIEPLLSWEDPEHYLHDRVAEVSDLDALATYKTHPEATQLAMKMRVGLKEIFRRHGCTHVQIGRGYPWADILEPATLRAIVAVKDAVDPLRLVNRGSLGLGGVKR